jgi:hypothetical protein
MLSYARYDEGIENLAGVPMGERKDGTFPDGTIGYLVNKA